MKFILFSLLIFTFSLMTSAQVAATPELSDKNKLTSHDLMKKLKSEGAILVRLKTHQNKIDALKRAGNVEAAKKVQDEQDSQNKSIIEAFRDTFNFCPVYFFYSSDSKYISRLQTDSVTFLNPELKPDTSIRFAEGFFLVAEFTQVGEVKRDRKEDLYYYSSTKGFESQNQMQGNTDMGFTALVIKDQHFNQLQRPFPYYVKTNDNIFFLRKSPIVAANQLNLNFYNFLGKVVIQD